ncbi:CPBP family intramembrane glutamic endopeptidase [Methanobrevibacter sp.]|uniref:CPBP family intramembrane glutamic endopeptidase n=1 Tax=Methanobrevibacter sp. TaxID=66852 RepID=UPI00386D9E75
MKFLAGFYVPSMSLTGSLPILGIFVSTVIISPIAEELIFRGVLLNRLKLITPTLFAVLVSSLLFGALHSFGSIISAFVFAICMAILYLKTENICVAILAHFLNNLFAEIIRYADYNRLIFTNDIVISIVSILAIVSAIILATSIITELNRIK